MTEAIRTTIAFAPTVALGVGTFFSRPIWDYLFQNSGKKSIPVSENLKTFVHEQCKAIGIENPEGINIFINDACGGPRIIGSDIFITNYEKGQYLKALDPKTDKQEASRILNNLKAAFQHEANHLKNKDFLRLLCASVLIPLTTNTVFTYLTQNSALNKNTPIAIISGCTLGLINFILLMYYSRHFEQQADNEIQDNKEILEGAINECKNYLSKDAEYNLFSNHPQAAIRIKKIQERIAAIGFKSH